MGTTPAVRRMATATSRRALSGDALLGAALPVLAVIALAATGCGSRASPTGEFGWLRAGPAPTGWARIAIPSGAVMFYPAGWRRVSGDPGTATAARFGAHHRFLGYLNLTPARAGETLAGWARFRIEHNAEEHDRDVVELGQGASLRFRNARGSCVHDAYLTTVGTRYEELACLVEGARGGVVIVAASPPGAWAGVSPVLKRAISSVIA